jgi:hypothetical protein
MKGKVAILIVYGVTGVRAALKPYHNVGLTCQHIGNFAFALVAPVGADYCFNHTKNSYQDNYRNIIIQPLPLFKIR